MRKPEPIEREAVLDYHECRDYLQEKYKYDERDYFKHHDHFQTYQKKTGDKQPYTSYPRETSTGKLFIGKQQVDREAYDAKWKEIHEHFQRYLDWEKENPPPPRADFWHWVCDNHEPRNGGDVWFDKEELEDKGMPDWVREIYSRYIDEFADERGVVHMLVEW